MDPLTNLMKNYNKFRSENPDIEAAIKDGYEIACYDEETEMIIAVELVGDTLKVKIIEDSHIIKKSA